ncbi:MAG: hypothetical protein LBL75_00395, partial [Rickettsiales bacterium]|nr:hypothetical protein [Rickettsiales bacterium]
NEIITTWNKVAQKLMVDMMDNTVPPFSVAAGTRITVFSPRDLIVNFCDKVGGACGVDGDGKPINLTASSYAKAKASDAKPKYNDGSWAGQVRSFNMEQYCEKNGTTYTGGLTSSTTAETLIQAGIDYRTAVAYCQSLQYTAINNAKQEAYYNSQIGTLPAMGTTEYNQQVLGLEYNADGTIKNPFAKEVVPAATTTTTSALTCEDGALPDLNGCCTGEVYTDMGDQGFNCCPSSGGDCFPPLL